jgi:rsbT co-antagonist protein RsbR
MNSVSKVSTNIIENAKLIATDVVEFNISKLPYEVPEFIKTNLIDFQTEFIQFLGEVINCENDQEVSQRFNEWYKIHEPKSTTSSKVSDIVAPYAEVRLFLNKRLTSISSDHHLPIEEAAMIQNRLNYMLDIGLTKAIMDNEALTEMEDKKKRKEIMELSSPIVPIQDGTAILPLIGTIDYYRAQHLFNHTVPKISRHKIESLIIDFSGIVNIDSEGANHIFNLYRVLRLLGIRVIFTGIRPDLASNTVGIGINFAGVESFSNVERALEHIGK